MVKRILGSIIYTALGLLALTAAGQAPPNPYVQIERLERARSLGGGQLARYLSSRDPRIAARAALAVGRTELLAGAPLLAAHLHDPRPGVRAMAVYGLGLIRDPRYAAAVIAAVGARNGAVAVAALDAVDRYEAPPTLFSARRERAAARALARTLRQRRDPILRARAATALEAFGTGAMGFFAERTLVAAFASERDAYVRWHIMWAVFRAYSVRVPRTFLTHALHDPSVLVRIEAVHALGRVENRDAIAALEPMTHDPSWRVQEQALESIRELRGEPLTAHLKAIPAGVHIPPLQPDPFADLPALPRAAANAKPAAPTAAAAIYLPRIDPTTSALMNGPAPGPHPRVRIVTTKGDVYVELYPEWAPLTVENFLNLAGEGYFDGNAWFRIVPDFVVQTGDPTGTGNGDAGYTLVSEENPLEQGSYVISMGLNYTDPPGAHAIRDSAGTQFYITLSPQLHLDRNFTVFGKVVGGFGVLGRLIESDKIVRIERIPDSGS